MAKTRRWKGFVFTQVQRPEPDEGFNEWRCQSGPAGNLELLAWPVFNGNWYATITYYDDRWFSNGQGKDFRSALNNALRNMRDNLKVAETEVKNLRLALQEAEETRGFYWSAVAVVKDGGKKKWSK
jgi:hypothetical protein